MVGSWLCYFVFVIFLFVLIFVFGYGYDVWGVVSVGMFVIVVVWLIWCMGGFEVVILLYIVNNVLIFLLGFVVLVDVNVSFGMVVDLVVLVLVMVVYVFFVDCWVVRFGIVWMV